MSVGRNTPFRTRLYDESPWYAPIEALLREVDRSQRFPTADELSALHRATVEARGLPGLRFIEVPRAKPRRKGPIDVATLYEGQVVRGEVPQRREDWHDLFNALAFMIFPRAKRALHARQFTVLQSRLEPGARKLPNARTREQDALALFDEGGLLVASVEPVDAVHEAALGSAMREGRANVVPFGHALYEHMVAGAPCPLATAFALQLPTPFDADALDRALAEAVAAPTAFLEPSPERGLSLPALLLQQNP